MRLARYKFEGEHYIGMIDGEVIHNVTDSLGSASMRNALAQLDLLRKLVDAGDLPSHPLAGITLEAPINDLKRY